MLLDEKQATELAKPIAKMADALEEFFKDPQNKKKYREWHLKKYGCLPGKKVVV